MRVQPLSRVIIAFACVRLAVDINSPYAEAFCQLTRKLYSDSPSHLRPRKMIGGTSDNSKLRALSKQSNKLLLRNCNTRSHVLALVRNQLCHAKCVRAWIRYRRAVLAACSHKRRVPAFLFVVTKERPQLCLVILDGLDGLVASSKEPDRSQSTA